MKLDGIEVRIINEFEYEGETWVEVEPVEFKSITREVRKSRLTNKEDNEEDIVTIICYGTVEKIKRKEAIKEYRTAMLCCEGAESERYKNIFLDLLEGATYINSDRY